MNKDRAIELLKSIHNNIDYGELGRDKQTTNEMLQAIDYAIEQMEEDKITLLQCVDGRVFVVDSKKSLDELTSESCKKCKRIDEQEEIRKEHLLKFEKPFMPSITPEELNEQTNKQVREMGKENIQKGLKKLKKKWEPYVRSDKE